MRALVAVAVAGVLAQACSSGGPTTASARDTIQVVSGTSTCEVLPGRSLHLGKNFLRVENRGGEATEVYLYGAGNRIVSEKEDVAPGTSATFTADIGRPGDYRIVCKPGQRGSGVTGLAVTVSR